MPNRKASTMPKFKIPDDEMDLAGLEQAEADYEPGEDFTYHGKQPPKGTILTGLIKKMWLSFTNDESARLLKVLFVADDNVGPEKAFNGLPVWENAALQKNTTFRWKPLIDHLGVTLRDIKTKIYLEDEDDPKNGSPITKVGSFVPGSDEAWCRILTDTDSYNGNPTTRVSVWLPYEEEEEEPEELADEDEADEPADEPADVVEEEPE